MIVVTTVADAATRASAPILKRFDVFKLVVFVGILAFVGNRARLGRLPRTRPILPGEIAVSD